MSEYASYTEAELEKVIEAKAAIKAREMIMSKYVDLLTEQANAAAAKEANDGESTQGA
jgi:hypothetical protein